jgi:fatty acid/phospholipid biosynthesis enzyme
MISSTLFPFMTKIIALIARPVLKDFKAGLDPGHYNGASLLGLRGIVIKSHGGLIPVREVIHSSEVSSVLDKSSLVTIFGGKYEPVPIILANLFIVFF